MMNAQYVGAGLLVIAGVVLFIVGLNATDSVADRMSNFFTGEYTQSTMWYLFGGGALVVLGVVLGAFGGRRAKT